MTEETKTPNIYEKVANIQREISVKKEWVNSFYKSKYMTLDSIMDKLQPLLDREWLVIFNMNIPWGVKTIVTDLDSTIVSEFTVDDIQDPQQLGKVITYWRRYNIVSIFNLIAEEDDDAQSFYEEKKTSSDRFEAAKKNTTFMKNCLDEEDYIAQVKKHLANLWKNKMTKQQETDLRICYQAANKSDDPLPFN